MVQENGRQLTIKTVETALSVPDLCALLQQRNIRIYISKRFDVNR